MAFTRTIETDWGMTVLDSYCRIEAVSLASKSSISFHLRFYAKPENKPFFKEQVFACSYDIDGVNPIKQAYLYLRSLPEFASAKDC
jgi:hypothetical protein